MQTNNNEVRNISLCNAEENAGKSQSAEEKTRFDERTVSKHVVPSLAIACVVLVFSLVPLLVLSCFNHPSADDFNYSILTHACVVAGGSLLDLLGAAFQNTLNFMQTWQGLYSSGFLLALQPGIFGESYYAVTGPLLLLIIFIGFFSIMRSLARNVLMLENRTVFLFITIVSFFLFIETMPSPVQGIYWFNGAINYMFFWMLFMVVVSLEIRYCVSEKRRIGILIVISIVCFVLAGGNHVTTVGCGIVTFALLVVSVAKQKRFGLVVPLLVLIIGFAIVMMAPGTAVRAEALETNSLGYISTLFEAAYYGAWFCVKKALSAGFLLFVALTVLAALYVLPSSPLKEIQVKLYHVLLAIVATWLLVVLQACVPIKAMGSAGAGRVVNVYYATYIVCMVIDSFVLAMWIRRRFVKGLQLLHKPAISRLLLPSATFVLLLVVLSGVACPTYSTTEHAVYELLAGQAQEYDNEQRERVEIINRCQASEIEVPLIEMKPTLLYLGDITEDPADWKNKSFARYYGFSKVTGVR